MKVDLASSMLGRILLRGDTLAGLATSVLLAAACASAPRADPAAESSAKAFGCEPGKGEIYLFREEHFRGSGASIFVSIDGQPLGTLDSGTFMHVPLAPKRYKVELSTTKYTPAGARPRFSDPEGSHVQCAELDLSPAQLIFLKAGVEGGWNGALPVLSFVSESEGKAGVKAVRMVLAAEYKP